VIGPEGAIYQGRPENVVGAHAQPNTGKVGISLVGNYETPNGDELTPETRKSLIKLLAWLAGSYSIDPGSHITGHKDWMSTDCPGQRVYEQLNQLRLDVAKYIADSEHGVPVVPEPPMPQDPSAPLNPVEMYPSEVGNGAQH
jgi:N-acetylmuramoyl-L-alanine amidase CwlA